MRPILVSKAAQRVTSFAARSYIAGNAIDDALRAVSRMESKGYLASICPWDRVEDPKEVVFRRYIQALEAIMQTGRDSYLSIKAPSIGYDRKMIQALLERAKSADIRIHFDAMSPETVNHTLTLVQDLCSNYQNIGVTLPARWRRSIADAHEMAKLGIPVRVVKGQWSDGSVPDNKIPGAFLEIIDALAGKAPLIALACHNLGLIKKAFSIMKAKGAAGELEQLYGLPFNCIQHVQPLNYPVRIYIPYGTAYLPYAMSQIRKNYRLGWWLTRDLIRSAADRICDRVVH